MSRTLSVCSARKVFSTAWNCGCLAPRMLAANSLLKVIAASGYPVDVGPLNAVAPGRVMFLHKPFSPEMLGTMVRRMLGTQEAEV